LPRASARGRWPGSTSEKPPRGATEERLDQHSGARLRSTNSLAQRRFPGLALRRRTIARLEKISVAPGGAQERLMVRSFPAFTRWAILCRPSGARMPLNEFSPRPRVINARLTPRRTCCKEPCRPPSSSGPGSGVLSPVTRVQIPLGVLFATAVSRCSTYGCSHWGIIAQSTDSSLRRREPTRPVHEGVCDIKVASGARCLKGVTKANLLVCPHQFGGWHWRLVRQCLDRAFQTSPLADKPPVPP
jgi:hypothetical protein